jgi:CelD/BcsL family acetyltransferase involved in cellulose biosynthesis
VTCRVRVVLLQEIPEDDELRIRWNALVEKTDRPQVFYTYEWALAVSRAYSETLKPLLFLAYDAHDFLCGVAALAVSPGQGRVSFLCATTGDYCDFISLPEYKADFVAALLAELNRRGTEDMVFTNLPADCDSVLALKQASKQQHLHCFARTAYMCAQISLKSLERGPDGRLVVPRKKMVRRFLNAMGHEAPVRLDHARSWDVLQPILPQFIQEHVARFLATGRISNLAHPERRKFLEELGKLLSTAGWMVCTRMMSGERVFAWNYGFQFHGTLFWYQPTFDSALEKYSPGFCLLSQLVGDAAQDATLQQIDMGLGAEEYKERFANQTRETLCVTLHTSAVRHFRGIALYRMAEALKTVPVAEAFARKCPARLSSVRAHVRRAGSSQELAWLGARVLGLLWLRTEVFFYEGHASVLAETSRVQLRPLDLHGLADAAIAYSDDPQTLAYLLRSAQRLRSGNAEGFAFHDAKGRPVHFAWVVPMPGFFLSELNARVDAPSPDAVMLFDCWTPEDMRGRGYYGAAIEVLAGQKKKEGKEPWIFSASSNRSSVRGLEKASFEKRCVQVRHRVLGFQYVTRRAWVAVRPQAAEVSARV